MLAQEAAVATLARSVVIGTQVAAGSVGPREYYQSEEEWLKALLRSSLNRR